MRVRLSDSPAVAVKPEPIAGHANTLVVGAFAILIVIGRPQSVLLVPNTPLLFQPSLQAVLVILIAMALYLSASQMARQRGAELGAEAPATLPAV